MKLYTNAELLQALKANNPEYTSFVDSLTQASFNKARDAVDNLGEVERHNILSIILRAYLDKVDISNAKNPLEEAGIFKKYGQKYGHYIQRLAVKTVTPNDPYYVEDGSKTTPDQFKKQYIEITERFFEDEKNFQCYLTIPDSVLLGSAFLEEYGLSTAIAGMIDQLRVAKTKWDFLVENEKLQKTLKETKWRDTQIIDVIEPLMKDQMTKAEIEKADTDIRDFIFSLKQLLSSIKLSTSAKAYNLKEFEDVINPSQLKVLVTPTLKNFITTHILADRHHPEYYALNNVNFVEVPELPDDTMAVVLHEDAFSAHYAAPYRVETARNAAGLYTNYWASQPRIKFIYDGIYTTVVFKKKKNQ